MKLIYPPSPRTLITASLPDLHPHPHDPCDDDHLITPCTPTLASGSQVVRTPTIATPSRSDPAVHFRHRLSPDRSPTLMTMKVETEIAGGSRSPRTSASFQTQSQSQSQSPSQFQSQLQSQSGPSKHHPPPLFHAHTDSPVSYSAKHHHPSMMRGSRRISRFDPMAGDEEDGDDDGYGELGGRHPLRRVDEGKEDSGVSLPGIKALFGVAGEMVSTSANHFAQTSR